MSDTMKIRAHHLLCMQGFQGYGYNEDFSENMSKVIKNLKSSPEQKIKIVTECDVICLYCPHNKKEKCKNILSNWIIKRMDRKVLKKLGLEVGTNISAFSIFSLVNERFKTYSDIQDICGDCKWNEKCLWFISRSK
jgi:hypothetical protein